MSVFAIADLHLSTGEGTDKSMEVFGPRWTRYTERLRTCWEKIVTPADTVVVAGDVSWGLSLEDALADLHFLDALPGRKILIKGNHDLWWPTAAKLAAAKEKERLDTLSFLFNNAFVADGFLICGTRGWFHDPETDGAKVCDADYDKVVRREAGRLRLSLEAGQALAREMPEAPEVIAFLHFPLHWGDETCRPLLDVLHEWNVKRAYFGHIHGAAPTSFDLEGVRMTLVAADAVGFVPQLIR